MSFTDTKEAGHTPVEPKTDKVVSKEEPKKPTKKAEKK